MIVNLMNTFFSGWLISSLLGKMKQILKNIMVFRRTAISLIFSISMLREVQRDQLKIIKESLNKTIKLMRTVFTRISKTSSVLLIISSFFLVQSLKFNQSELLIINFFNSFLFPAIFLTTILLARDIACKENVSVLFII